MSDPTKPRMSLIPLKALEPVARVLEKGLKNGRQVGDWQQCDPQLFLDACIRHLSSHLNGEKLDESGESHLACATTNAIILLWHQQQGGQKYGDAGDKSEGREFHSWNYNIGKGCYYCEKCGIESPTEPSISQYSPCRPS